MIKLKTSLVKYEQNLPPTSCARNWSLEWSPQKLSIVCILVGPSKNRRWWFPVLSCQHSNQTSFPKIDWARFALPPFSGCQLDGSKDVVKKKWSQVSDCNNCWCPSLGSQIFILPSRGLTYPTLGKGKSSSNMPYQGDMLIPWRVFHIHWTVQGLPILSKLFLFSLHLFPLLTADLPVIPSFSQYQNLPTCAALKRRARCWFILAPLSQK